MIRVALILILTAISVASQTPNTIPNMVFWVDPASGVTTNELGEATNILSRSSGPLFFKTNSVSAPILTNNAINGHPALLCDATARCLITTNMPSLADYTFFAVVKVYGGSATWFSKGQSTLLQEAYLFTGSSQSIVGASFDALGTAQHSTQGLRVTHTGYSTAFQVICVTKQGMHVKVYVNGALAAVINGGNPTLISPLGAYYTLLGNQGNGSTGVLLAEQALWSRCLATNELVTMNEYFSTNSAVTSTFTPSASLPRGVAFVGDSMTVGVGSVAPDKRTMDDTINSPTRIWDYANNGMASRDAYQVDAAVDTELNPYLEDGDIVSLWIGTNDIFDGRTSDQVIQSISNICYSVKAAHNGVKVILTTIINRAQFTNVAGKGSAEGADTGIQKTVNDFIRGPLLNTHHLCDTVFDAQTNASLQDAGTAPNTYFQSGGTHLTTAGCNIISDGVSAAITNALAVVEATNRVDWVVGQTVGLQRAIPTRNNLINVTQAPYNADNTGSADAATAINSAITAAASNDVVYLPTGRYKLLSQLTIDKSYITLRGDGPTNSVLMGLGAQSAVIVVGHDGISSDPKRVFTNTVSITKGSTNAYITKTTDGYGSSLAAGDLLILSEATRQLSPSTNAVDFPVISVANYDRIIKQPVIISTISGTNLTLTIPASFDFTNHPQMLELSPGWFAPPRQMVGLENFGVTLTNGGTAGSAGFMIQASCVRDCWFTNLDLGFANNYQFDLVKAVNCTFTGCNIHDPLSSGTSHSGLLVANATGCLIENNIFSSDPARGLQLFPAIEFNDGVMGNAFFGNYFTNNQRDINCHNTHPAMNLWEGNVMGTYIEMDGYFGSSSHQTVFRNVIPSTTPLKRWTTFMQFAGNVMGSTNLNYVYYREDSGYNTAPWGIFEFGFPNIGNSGYTGTNPPVPWNYPGDSFVPFVAPFTALTNGAFKFTSDYGPTNVLWTNMGIGSFTNIPAPITAGYAILFQDPNNTNVYWGDTNGSVLVSIGAGTSSNLTLASWVYVTNGETLYVAGQNNYQQLQYKNKSTHNLHGNLVYTNTAGTVVWNLNNPNHNLPTSLLYPDSAPSWWGTNRWPAIDPTNAAPVAKIPAQVRYETGYSPGNTVATLTTIGSGSRISIGSGAKVYFQ